VHRGGAGKTRARLRDGLRHHRGLADAKPGATVGFRHGDAEPPVARAGLMEIRREAAFAVALQPVVVIETRA
jgi:hypothetical protein